MRDKDGVCIELRCFDCGQKIHKSGKDSIYSDLEKHCKELHGYLPKDWRENKRKRLGLSS